MSIIIFPNEQFDMDILRNQFRTEHELHATNTAVETSFLSFSKFLAA